MRFSVYSLVFLALLLFPSAGHADELTARVIAEGQACVAWFHGGTLDPLHRRFSAPMANAFGLEQLIAFREQMSIQAGEELEVIEERTEVKDGLNVYIRRVKYEHIEAAMDVIFAFNRQFEVEAFLITNAPEPHPSKHLDYSPHTRFALPFAGEWWVFWGGRTVDANYHAAHRDQRFAVDAVMKKNDLSYRDDGSANEHYFCFDAPITAPADGEVVSVVDGIKDNVPGVMNPDTPLGNYVVLNHGNDEYSFFAHFKQGSVNVKPGQRVSTGDVLGHCGNSGNSSEPHLHVHLQNTPDAFEGDGLPMPFCEFYINGVATTCAEPERGQTIRRD